MWQPEHPPSQTVASRGFLFIRSIGSPDPLFLFPRRHDVLEEATVFTHFSDGPSFVKKSTSGTYLDALAAASARIRGPPAVAQIGDNQRIGPASHDVPGMRTLDLIADADASRA